MILEVNLEERDCVSHSDYFSMVLIKKDTLFAIFLQVYFASIYNCKKYANLDECATAISRWML